MSEAALERETGLEPATLCLGCVGAGGEAVRSVRTCEHAVAGREGGVALGGLGAAIGRAVAAHHLRGAVAEQVLDIEFARVMGDSPGGERVPAAMGVHLGDVGGAPTDDPRLRIPGERMEALSTVLRPISTECRHRREDDGAIRRGVATKTQETLSGRVHDTSRSASPPRARSLRTPAPITRFARPRTGRPAASRFDCARRGWPRPGRRSLARSDRPG